MCNSYIDATHFSSQLQEITAKAKKERDFHRMHHKRLSQDKAKLAAEIRRLQEKRSAVEPELEALKNRFEMTHRDLTIARMERTNLAQKVEELTKALKEANPQQTDASEGQIPTKEASLQSPRESTSKMSAQREKRARLV